MSETDEICVINGSDDDAVTHREHNRWVRIAVALHLRPMKQSIDLGRQCLIEMKQELKDHVEEERTTLKTVLVVSLVTLLGVIASLIVYIWKTHVQ